MKVQLLNDSSAGLNWGGIATTAGLKRTFAARWPEGELGSVPKAPLPFRKIKCLRRFAEGRLAGYLQQPGGARERLAPLLARLNFRLPPGPLPDRLFLNGEGAIRDRSGHVARLLGIARLYQLSGTWVGAVNHSIELGDGSRLVPLVRNVYRQLDHVTVREPISYRGLQRIGVENARLVPDAAFAHPPLAEDEIETHLRRMGLPEAFVCISGSSALCGRSMAEAEALLQAVKEVTELPIVMLSSTKTDIALGETLRARHRDLRMIAPPEGYEAAMAAIARAKFLAGGRFHPAIFAARNGTPILVLPGNTHKMSGLVEMLGYPLPAVSWRDPGAMVAGLKVLLTRGDDLGQMLRERSSALAEQVRQVTGD